MDKHLLNHVTEQAKEETNPDEMGYRVKLEPEMGLREYKKECFSDGEEVVNDRVDVTDGPADHFMFRLLDELDDSDVKRRGRKLGSKNAKFKDYKCEDCKKEFIYHKTLLKHCVQRHGMSIDEVPPRIRKLRKGLLNSDGTLKKIACDICGDNFKFKSGLYNHKKRMHFDTEKKQCPRCPRLVKSSFLEQHIKQEHSTPRFTCSWCGKGFYYQSLMLEHQRIHTGDFKQCICDLCGAAYKNLKVLRRHVNNAHQDIRSFQCSHCDKAFHTKQRLERHTNSHTKAKHFQCPVCHIRSDRKDNLRTHIRKNHGAVINAETVELLPITGDDQAVVVKQAPSARSTPIDSISESPTLVPKRYLLTEDADCMSFSQEREPNGSNRSTPHDMSMSHTMNIKTLLLPNVSVALKPSVLPNVGDLPPISSRSSSHEGEVNHSVPVKELLKPAVSHHQVSPMMTQQHLQMQPQSFIHHPHHSHLHPGQIFAQKSSL